MASRSSSSSSRQHRARGINTLIGNGWLREPQRPSPRGFGDPRSRSAMRKCMFLDIPPEVRALGPILASPAIAPPPRRPEPPIEARRSDPGKYAREIPAFPNLGAARPKAAPLVHAGREPMPQASGWWEDPIAVGSLLILLPPVGLAALWTSRRYSSDARWALTIVTALMMCLMTAAILAIAILAR